MLSGIWQVKQRTYIRIVYGRVKFSVKKYFLQTMRFDMGRSIWADPGAVIFASAPAARAKPGITISRQAISLGESQDEDEKRSKK